MTDAPLQRRAVAAATGVFAGPGLAPPATPGDPDYATMPAAYYDRRWNNARKAPGYGPYMGYRDSTPAAHVPHRMRMAPPGLVDLPL